ncbi:MAG: hypothetical protein IT555_21850, partial [Acetobacteraceae bacterium]|nr:hypothetical protein [Acetobacteraceae bacterium]
GVALDILGPIISAAEVTAGGALIAGEVLDPRYHANLAWHGREPDLAFAASLVVPATPSRGWDVTPPPASQPPVPPVIPAWKGKAALRESGLLDAVEAAVVATGGRVQDAWAGASEWSRNSEFLVTLAEGLGLPSGRVDALFRSADLIHS